MSVALFLGISARAQSSLDPAFAVIGFDQWSENEAASHFRWSTHISAPQLSPHQRLQIATEIRVSGAELVKRQGQGTLLLLIQLQDQAGHVYQAHNSISLDNLAPEAAGADSAYQQDAFIAPGDYQVSLGAFVSSTKEHAIAHRKVHVDPLPHDPLPDLWRDVPAVEFLPDAVPPESWFLPTIQGHLRLALKTERPLQLEVLVNGSRTEQPARTRSMRASRVSAGDLIPPVKVLSQVAVANGSLDIAMLDLERRLVSFEQTGGLDWAQLKTALADSDPNRIDLASLEHRAENAAFFLSEIQRRLAAKEPSGALHALIVMSGPMAFHKADVKPLQVPPNPDRKVFYIRFHARLPESVMRQSRPIWNEPQVSMRRPGARGRAVDPGAVASDELAGLLKPLNPKLYDVTTPAEFRKALAAVVGEICKSSCAQ